MGLGTNQATDILLTILSVIFMIIFGGAIYAFVMAIFQFLFSKGDQEKLKKASNTIRYMLVGLLLAIALLFTLPILTEKMGLENHEEYTAKNIINKSAEIFDFILDAIDGTRKELKATQGSGKSNTNTSTRTSSYQL